MSTGNAAPGEGVVTSSELTDNADAALIRQAALHRLPTALAISIRDTALAANRAGIVAIPVKENGSKAPDLRSWKPFIKRHPSLKESDLWFGESTIRTGIGFVCGSVSGGLEVVDFDERSAWDAYVELAENSGCGDLLKRVQQGYLARTPNGRHLAWFCQEIEGSQKLASRSEADSKVKTLIETRGEGAYVIAPPSHGGVHPSGEPYVQEHGGPESIVAITPEERDILLVLARALNKIPSTEPSSAPGPRTENNDAPGSLFNDDQSVTTTGLFGLHGWEVVWQRGEVSYLRRPGKTIGISASVGYIAPDIARIFTTSTTFEPRSYDKFGVYAVLSHGGDFSAAARLLRENPKYRHEPGQLVTPTNGGTPSLGAFDYSMNNDGDAEYFAQKHRDDLRYDHQRGTFFLFGPHHWQVDQIRATMQLAREANRERIIAAADCEDSERRRKLISHLNRSGSRQSFEAVLALAQSANQIADKGDRWDANPTLLGVQNGVVDLQTGQLRDGRTEDGITKVTAVAFDPAAVCPRWMQFLDEVFDSDPALIDFVQRAVGYSLSGVTTSQIIFFLHGTGANGKSVFESVISGVAGDYGYTLPFSALEFNPRSARAVEIAEIPGKRLVVTSEVAESARLNEARIKALTGDDELNTRRNYGHPFTFKPVAKYWLAMNHLPRVTDDSEGFWRRVRLIPFNRTFGPKDRDPNLEASLRKELPGILRWAVEGAVVYFRDGIDAPNSVLLATKEYRTSSDPLADFIDECCERGAGYEVVANQAFLRYTKWCAAQGITERDQLKMASFGTKIKMRFESQKRKTGRYYIGFRLRDRLVVTGDGFGGESPNFPPDTSPVGEFGEKSSHASPVTSSPPRPTPQVDCPGDCNRRVPGNEECSDCATVTMRDALRRECFELGETAGWPALPYKPGYSIAQGAAHWRVWMKRASVPDMVMVVDAIPNVLSQFRVGE
jgi:putative DNA primase/helicase